jgi:hypothetical protein
MMKDDTTNKNLTKEQEESLLSILKSRFFKHPERHSDCVWEEFLNRLKKDPHKIWTIYEMERTGGEPDVIGYDGETESYLVCDCSQQSPSGRRSLCYDDRALEERKDHKPKKSAVGMAEEMGVKLLSEVEYRKLQELGEFDTTTSGWIETPGEIRELGGALFGDCRYKKVFIYHNGASSYYGARGFRALVRV